MASGKPDFGRLLTAFGRGTRTKPAQSNRADIRLPSLARLLEIDAQGELAGSQVRAWSEASRNPTTAEGSQRRR